MNRLMLVILGLAAGALGCSASSSTPSSAGMTSSPGDATEPASTVDAGSACSTLSPVAGTATLHLRTDAEPPPRGGPLADGTFVLTDVTRYDLPVAEDDRDYIDRVTMRVDRGAVEIVTIRTVAGRETEIRSTSTFTTSGTSLTAEDVCPSARTTVFGYTATGGALDLFGTFLGSRMVQHFERAPEP